MSKIKVYPTHEMALVITHPLDGPLSDAGSLWERDALTGRLLDSNEITTDPARAHLSSREVPDHARPPAHATYPAGATDAVPPVPGTAAPVDGASAPAARAASPAAIPGDAPGANQ